MEPASRTFSPKSSRKPKRKPPVESLRPILPELEGEENIHPPNGKNSPRDISDPMKPAPSPRESSKKKSPRFGSIPSPRAGPLLKKRDKGAKEAKDVEPTGKHEETRKHSEDKDKQKKTKREKEEKDRITHDDQKRDDREDRDSKREREDRADRAERVVVDRPERGDRDSKREKDENRVSTKYRGEDILVLPEGHKFESPSPRKRERSSFPRKDNSPRVELERDAIASSPRSDKLGRANTAPPSLKRDKKKAPSSSPQSPRRAKLKELELPFVAEIRITSASPRQTGSPPVSPRTQPSPRKQSTSLHHSPLHSPRSRAPFTCPSTPPHASPRPKTMTSGAILSALTPPISPRSQVSDHAASGTSEEDYIAGFGVIRDEESHAGSGTSSDDMPIPPPPIPEKRYSDKRKSNHRGSKEHDRHDRRGSISQTAGRRSSIAEKTPVPLLPDRHEKRASGSALPVAPRRASVDKTPVPFDVALARRSSIGQHDKRSSLDKRGQSTTDKNDKIKIHLEVSDEDHLESTTEDAEVVVGADDDALSNSEGAKVPKKPLLQIPKSIHDIPTNTMTKSCSSTASDRSKATLNTTHEVPLPTAKQDKDDNHKEANLSSNSVENTSETEQTVSIIPPPKLKPRLPPLHHLPTMTKSSSSDLKATVADSPPATAGDRASTSILYSPGRQQKLYLLSKSASSSRAQPEPPKRVMKRHTRATSRSSSTDDEFSDDDHHMTKSSKILPTIKLYQPNNLRIQDPDWHLVSMDYQTLEETEGPT